MPDVLILSGPPAAGKSSVARAMAERYDRVAHVEVDVLRHFVTPTGYIAPGRPGFERQAELATRNACCLARNFLAERFAVILDDVLTSPEELDLYVRELEPAGFPVHHVRLLPSLEATLARNQEREAGRVAPERVRKVWSDFTAVEGFPGVTLDSSDLSVYETADHLQALTTSGRSLVWAPAAVQP
jgi:chloramphenicol 3-O-phosphotransferase